jgi:hypothetical protein
VGTLPTEGSYFIIQGKQMEGTQRDVWIVNPISLTEFERRGNINGRWRG